VDLALINQVLDETLAEQEEAVHYLVRVLNAGGESATAQLVAKLGSTADTARELCYRLYTICERKKRSQEALAYNTLVQSWPEILRLSKTAASDTSVTGELFDNQ
jgi:putative DNA methylase